MPGTEVTLFAAHPPTVPRKPNRTNAGLPSRLASAIGPLPQTTHGLIIHGHCRRGSHPPWQGSINYLGSKQAIRHPAVARSERGPHRSLLTLQRYYFESRSASLLAILLC